jgi:hypothetical protein
MKRIMMMYSLDAWHTYVVVVVVVVVFVIVVVDVEDTVVAHTDLQDMFLSLDTI